MARFLFTMNMPSRNGNVVHQITAEHPAETIEEMNEILQESDFILVREFYKEGGVGMNGRDVGMVCLNVMMIGKVKIDNKPVGM